MQRVRHSESRVCPGHGPFADWYVLFVFRAQRTTAQLTAPATVSLSLPVALVPSRQLPINAAPTI